MIELFRKAAAQVPGHLELRLHRMELRNVTVVGGAVERVSDAAHVGIGVRCSCNGGTGYASTTGHSLESVVGAARQARAIALMMADDRTPQGNNERSTAQGEWPAPESLRQLAPLSDRIALARDACQEMTEASALVSSTYSAVTEQWHQRWVFTSDGAEVFTEQRLLSHYVNAHAGAGTAMTRCADVARIEGGWDELLAASAGNARRVAESAVRKLNAVPPRPGKHVVVLTPQVVGTLVHEAVGHPVEADFVLAGSAAAGKLGRKVASEAVTIVDFAGFGPTSRGPIALRVDDEGVLARDVMIIQDGVLTNYLHNRATAQRFGVEPAGNARAFRYSDEPLIRMRNTAMLPGQKTLEQMISEIDHGYFLTRIYNGEADVNGEFMFSITEGHEIAGGALGAPLRDHIISGRAWDVLDSVDAVSRDFAWVGGVCGKGQLAVVGMGGPAIRCQAVIGG